VKMVMAAPNIGALTTAKNLLPSQHFYALGKHISSLGFVYQILSLTSRKDALRATQTANKAISLDQLIAFTQLYTPNWVVDFLVANTVLPLVQLPTTLVDGSNVPADVQLKLPLCDSQSDLHSPLLGARASRPPISRQDA